MPSTGLFAWGLAVITFAVYSPALTHEFLTYDDQQYVTENRHVLEGLSWSGAAWAFKTLYASNWHPLTWLSHMLDCRLYGLHPAGHHLTNVLLHVASTVLLFLVLRRMTGALWRSAAVAALFGWHPLHVQSVAWIAERKDVLSGLFWMLTLWAYAKYAERKKEETGGRRQKSGVGSEHRSSNAERRTSNPGNSFEVRSSKFEVRSSNFRLAKLPGLYALTLFFFLLALFSKPMVVTLPFVLLLLDYWPLGRLELDAKNLKQKAGLLLEKMPFFALAAGGCFMAVFAQGSGYTLVSTAGLPLARRLGHALVAYVHYISATFIPWHLAAFYPYPTQEGWAQIAGAGLLLLLITVLVLRAGSRKQYLFTGWFWFLGTLVPVIGLVQVGDQAWADRYTYLPLIGLFIMLAWGVADTVAAAAAAASVAASYRGPRPRTKSLALRTIEIAALLAGLALLAATWSELRWWKDTRTLFQHAAAVTQRNGRAITMVGTFLADDGKLDEAMSLYRQALAYNPSDPEAHFFLARAYEKQGKLDAAAEEYTLALWFRPLQEKTHIFLGVLRAKQGQTDQAAAHYRAALAINPQSASAENDLARVLHSQGNLDEAIAHYSAAIRFDPDLAQAHNNLGVLLLQKGRLPEGITQLKEALRLNPGDAEAEYNLAAGLNQQQQWQAAADMLNRLAPSRAQDANLHYQLALALSHLDQTRNAMSHYAQALLLKPDFLEALDGLSWILATDPRPELRNGPQSLQMSTLACDLTSRKRPAFLATLAAAYAENGQFPQAVSTVEQAYALAASSRQPELAKQCRNMADAFRVGKPWHEKMSGGAGGVGDAVK